MTARHALYTFSLICAGLALSACPDVSSGKRATQCSKAYEQCTLKPGVLGVCDVVACDGGPPPCLVCRSQH